MITSNDNGVLHTLGTVSANNGGVLREMNTIHTNDGGVLREIYSASVGAATVEGITPLVVAEDHIVIVDSGTFTLSAPAGARIIVGGAAKDTSGGNVAEYVLDKNIRNAVCVSQCAAVNSGGATTLTVNGTAYGSGSIKQIIQSKWGPIGGEGGKSGDYDNSGNYIQGGRPGTGAAGGGGPSSCLPTDGQQHYLSGGKGGNNGGYGNFGGNGGGGLAGTNLGGNVVVNFSSGYDGASGQGGTGSYRGNGGGGGFSAGGGEYAAQGGAGIIVIEW